MRAFALSVLLASALANRGVAAAAASEPIVLASGDPAFQLALAGALAPAGMTVVTVSDAPPNAIDIANSSRAIADREHATSTVWLLADPTGTTLITYDRGVDRVLVRSVPYVVPLDAAQAAELARMARTMLRALRVTPEVDLPLPHADEAARVRARALVVAVEAPVVVPPSPAIIAIDTNLGVKLGGPGADADVGVAVAGILRPDELGASLSFAWAPSADFHAAMFAGRISDVSIALAARLPVRIGDRLIIAAAAGPALHRIRIDGAVPAGSATSPRFDPALHVGLALQYELGRVDVGLGVSADGLLRRQTYEVGSEAVLGVPAVQVSVGLTLMARIL